MDEADDMSLDDHSPMAPLGDDVDPIAQPNGDAAEMSASRWQPRGLNIPHELRIEIRSGDMPVEISITIKGIFNGP